MTTTGEALSVATNAPEVLAKLRAFPRDQLPFAVALSLTRLAVKLRDVERARWKSEFKVRAEWTTRQVTFDLTRKKEWPNPSVKVGDLYRPAATLETGGSKGPDAGFTDVFVPTRFVAAQRSSSTGRLPVALQPKSLIGRGLVHVETLPGLGKALVLNERVGKTAKVLASGKIVAGRQRFGATRINAAAFTKTGQQRALFLLRSDVKIPERFGFGKAASEFVRKNYAAIFLQAMDYAVATRRA